MGLGWYREDAGPWHPTSSAGAQEEMLCFPHLWVAGWCLGTQTRRRLGWAIERFTDRRAQPRFNLTVKKHFACRRVWSHALPTNFVHWSAIYWRNGLPMSWTALEQKSHGGAEALLYPAFEQDRSDALLWSRKQPEPLLCLRQVRQKTCSASYEWAEVRRRMERNWRPRSHPFEPALSMPPPPGERKREWRDLAMFRLCHFIIKFCTDCSAAQPRQPAPFI